MVDIAASLSLTSTGPTLDAGAVLGLETADMHAFGDILAGKVGAGDTAAAVAGAPANPFATLAMTAGNRQPDGKILPDAAAVLPEAAAEAEMPAAPAVDPVAVMPTLVTAKFVASLARTAEQTTPEAETVTPEAAKQAEASPVHGLIKMLTAALKGQRSAAEAAGEQAEAVPAGEEASAAEASAPAIPVLAIPATAIVQVQAALSLPTAAPATATSASRAQFHAPVLPGAHAAPRAAQRAAAQSAVQAAINPAQTGSLPVTGQTAAAPVNGQVATQPGVQDAAAATRAPVLTLAAATEAPAAAVTLLTKPVLPATARGVTAQIKLAPAKAQSGPAPASDRGAPAAAATPFVGGQFVAAESQAADRSAAALRAAADRAAPLADRAVPDFTAAPVLPVADGSAQAAAPAATVPGAAPTTGAELPRQDFAALVERLVEARNAGAAQSTHASVQHAEFGQVSLKFQQDGRDLSVSMTSADPDFAIAAQAAMPADRQNFHSNADAQPRQNQGQQQTSAQPNANSSHSQHEASAQRDATGTDQQGRGNRGGRQSDRNDHSNPSSHWGDGDQPQSRGGIFA